MGPILQLAVGVAFAIVSYAVLPKPKQPRPPETKDLEAPTTEAGRPIPVVFGSMKVQGLNTLWWGERSTVKLRAKNTAGGKK